MTLTGLSSGRDEERRRDLLLGLALLAQREKRAELVERMKRRALDVLGEAVFLGEPLGAHHAGDRGGAGEPLLLDQEFERPEAAAAGRDLEHAGLGALVVEDRPDGEALQQRAPGDVLGKLLDRDARLDAADIGLAQDQPVERDVARAARARSSQRTSAWIISATGRPRAFLSTP